MVTFQNTTSEIECEFMKTPGILGFVELNEMKHGSNQDTTAFTSWLVELIDFEQWQKLAAIKRIIRTCILLSTSPMSYHTATTSK